jgi:protein OPY2
MWYRRNLAKKGLKEKADVPAPASTVLNRPDPTEKSLSIPTELHTVRPYEATIDTNPDDATARSATIPYTADQLPSHTNPFDDGHSIQTTGTDGTNVIPIAFVPPESPRSQTETLLQPPTRPAHSPDLNLNLDHVNVSRDSLRASPHTQASAASESSARHSYMSAASYASDFLNEAPMIITPTKGTIRQVLGVVKAEVIRTPSSHSETLKPPRLTRPSPLATGSFGPADMARDSTYEQDIAVPGNPFSDEHSPRASSEVLSHTTTPALGLMSQFGRDSEGSIWAKEPRLPWAQSGDLSRPSSLSTQAGSVIDIGSATRVNVGLGSSTPASGIPRSPYRTTMARLVSPPTQSSASSLAEQQQRALAHAQARAQAQGGGIDRRDSGSSVLSATSTRADSILESFPFVPPSPISDRPARTPPCSPLAQQVFNGSPAESPPPDTAQSILPPPPDRRLLGLSTASNLSTSSSGLGSFPFQIEAPPGQVVTAPRSSLKVRQRASLDTLALTSDLSSYPLGGFDQDTRDSYAALQPESLQNK